MDNIDYKNLKSEFKSEYLTGFSEIDTDHKSIFKLYTKVQIDIANRINTNIESHLLKLISRTYKHIQNENKFLKTYLDVPELEYEIKEHIKRNCEFLDLVFIELDKYLIDEDIKVNMALILFKWIRHITMDDKKIFNLINEFLKNK